MNWFHQNHFAEHANNLCLFKYIGANWFIMHNTRQWSHSPQSIDETIVTTVGHESLT